MRRFLIALLVIVAIYFLLRPSTVASQPRVGQALPTFVVQDLAGTRHTPRDLVGEYTVICAMTDKDIGDTLEAWWRAVELGVPPGTRMLTFSALDLFGLIPTSTVVSLARERTPRNHWSTVWLSRDGSLAESLGLADSELPWVFVLDRSGRVLVRVHAVLNSADLTRVLAAIPRPEPRADALRDAGAGDRGR